MLIGGMRVFFFSMVIFFMFGLCGVSCFVMSYSLCAFSGLF